MAMLLLTFAFLQPMEVYVDDDSKLTLHGLQQHYVKLKDNEKNRKLFELLDALEFNQVSDCVSSGWWRWWVVFVSGADWCGDGW